MPNDASCVSVHFFKQQGQKTQILFIDRSCRNLGGTNKVSLLLSWSKSLKKKNRNFSTNNAAVTLCVAKKQKQLKCEKKPNSLNKVFCRYYISAS